MNGNTIKVLLALLILTLSGMGTLILMATDDLKASTGTNATHIDTLTHRVDKMELEQAKGILQWAEIAKGINRISDAGIPIIVDTTHADSIVARDST